MKAALKLGRCHPAEMSAPVALNTEAGGSPIHGAETTPSRLRRSADVAAPVAELMVVMGPVRVSSTHDSTTPNTSPRKMAMRDRNPGSSTEARMTNDIVINATHGSRCM